MGQGHDPRERLVLAYLALERAVGCGADRLCIRVGAVALQGNLKPNIVNVAGAGCVVAQVDVLRLGAEARALGGKTLKELGLGQSGQELERWLRPA